MAVISGTCRNARSTPPGPTLSPTVCAIPYRAGISTSRNQPSAAPTAMVVVTNRAPGSASRRSVCGSNVRSAPACSANLRPTRAIVSAASASRSTRWTVQPEKAGDWTRSVIRPGVNTVLPAPISTSDVLVTGISLPRSGSVHGVRPGSFGATGEQAGHDVAVERQRKQHRHRDGNHSRRGQQAARHHMSALQRRDYYGQRLGGDVAGEHQREQELGPGEQEGDEGGGDDAGPGQWQQQVPQHLQAVRAVDEPGFLDAVRQSGEVVVQDPGGQR